MNVPTPVDLSEFDKSLDEYKVEVMVYEPHLDAPWVYLYRHDPAWVIESGHGDLVVFYRNPEIAFDR